MGRREFTFSKALKFSIPLLITCDWFLSSAVMEGSKATEISNDPVDTANGDIHPSMAPQSTMAFAAPSSPDIYR